MFIPASYGGKHHCSRPDFRFMMSSFRRFAASPLGVGIFAIILIAFVVTLYEGKSGFGGDSLGSGGTLASAGGKKIGEAEVRQRAQTQLEAARQQQPELTMAAFVAAGGVEQTIDQMQNGRVLELFAKSQGMVASKRLVDGHIASIPAFNGPTGKFDRNIFLSTLAQRKIPEVELRQDFAREILTKALLTPIAGAAQMPIGLVQPYAQLLLEKRDGLIGAVPSAAFANLPAPTDAEISAFYSRNIARYTLPERRVVRYALFDRSRFAAQVKPAEAEIANFYKSGASTYAAKETRGLTQVIVQTREQAEQLLAKAKGGQSLADAAKSVGRAPLVVPPGDEASFAKLTSPTVAQAAFEAPKGGFAAVTQSGLGYHVIHVDTVVSIPAKTLAEVRPAIITQLSQQKLDEAASAFVAKLNDEADGGATFDEITKKYGLTAQTTPALTKEAQDPDQPAYNGATELSIVLRDAFLAEPDDQSAVATLGAGASFALWHLDKVVPAAPRPLAQVRSAVIAEASRDAASAAAKKTADAIVAKINAGMPMAQAIATAGVKLPAPQPAGGRRLDIARAGDKVPPPIALLFTMPEKRAKVLGIANGQGWFIVYLGKIDRTDTALEPGLIQATQQQLSRVISDEYAGQFVNALKAQVGTKRDPAAIEALKRSLVGGASAQ
jgi:peptidyl-prolyl cis-trans isomerase D